MHPDTLQLIQVLEKTVSPDKNELEQASTFLEQAAAANILEFIKTLSDILRHGGNSPVARMAAGLQLKNQLTSKDPNIKQLCQQRWLSAPDEIRDYIKKNVVGALGTETNRPSSAAQCVAYIAVTELPHHQWPDLIATLVSNVVQANSTEMQKEATLEAIGYICQEIDSDVLVAQSNDILTAIIHGMRTTEPSNHVRFAATQALLNSLEFTKANFEKATERNFIMEVVCEATQSPDTQIKVAALQCLVKIMSLYYQYMEPYMGQALFPITLEAMKSDNDAVALQGIEFWSNVSDEEVDLAIEANEAADAGRPPTRVSRHYAKGALQFIVPILLQKLTKQEELDDEDDWNPSKAAGVCLMLLATCCENEIVPHVLPFIKENIKSDNWRFRDASLMAFGSILGGLDNTTLKPLVEQAMPTLIELMYDSSVIVRDTAAWTFGRICEIIPEAAINDNYLKPLLESLINGLKAEPRVAANVCWAFSGLAEAAYDAADTNDASDTPDTYILSQYFEYIVQRLLETTDRLDGAQANLRPAAYEALMEMVKNSPKDCYVTVQKTTMVILERLQQVLQMETHITSHNDRSQFNDLQSLLCGTLQSVLRKVTPEDAPQISDAIMTAMLTMFSSNSCKSGGVQEDALMAVSTLVEVLGEGFLKYMDAFKPYLYIGLKNHQEYQVCGTAVGLTGDIFRALKLKALPYCDEIMTLLLENLGDQSVHRSVKPQILSVFGDIVLSIGPEFKKYLDVVLTTLAQASQAQVDRNDFDMIDYLNELREGVLDAYTGIIQGLKGDGPTPNPDVMILEPHIPFIVQFITVVAQDTVHSDATVAVAAGLVGDLCTAFGAPLLQLLDLEPINEMLAQGRRSGTSRTKTLANWATKELRRLKANSTAAVASCRPVKQTQTRLQFELVCDKEIYPTLGLVALNLGGPVGVYYFGQLNDSIGRKKSFFACLTTLLLGSVLTATAQNFWWWAGSRVIVGLTIPAIYQIPFIISLELVGPNYRSFVTVMVCLFYTLGLLMLAAITYLIRDWVRLAMATSLPFALYYLYWFFLPESPRWLLAKGRFEEASHILETLARVNGRELPSSFKQELKQRVCRRSSSEEEALRKTPPCTALCATPNMRLKTALITASWFANEVVYVGLSYYGPSLGSDEYMSFFLSSAIEVPSYLTCWLMMDRWGRRWPLCLCMIVSGVCCIAAFFLPNDAVDLVLVFFLMAKSAIAASFLIIYPFAGELFPTQLRGLGIGVAAYIGGLGRIIIPFITFLGSEMVILPLLIMGIVSVVGGLISLRLPETLHYRLPQTLEEGEEFGKNFTVQDCIRCIPLKPDGSSFSSRDNLELESIDTEACEETPLGRSLRGKMSIHKLVKQASVMDTPKDADGSMKITNWF